MIKLLISLKKHLGYHREAYFVAPLAFAALWLSILFVGALTGRDVTEDLGSLVATMVALSKIALICLFVGAIQKHFFGYRSEETPTGLDGKPGAPRLADDLYDAGVTVFLFVGIGWVVFCK
jgi:hypothetical protein